jgi:hypothetical protein
LGKFASDARFRSALSSDNRTFVQKLRVSQVARTYADAFNALLDAYQQIWENLPLLEQADALFESDPNMKAVLVYMFEDIIEFHREH